MVPQICLATTKDPVVQLSPLPNHTTASQTKIAQNLQYFVIGLIEVIAKPRRRAAPDLSRYPALTLRIHEIDTLSTLVFQSKCPLLGTLVWSCSSSPLSVSFLQFIDL
jgi:hypothetical protein